MNEVKISFSFYPKQFKAFGILRDSQTTELCFGGAAGGAKTFLGCAWQIINRLQFPGTRGLIGRARLKNLKNTTLKTFFEVASRLGLVFGKHYWLNAQSGQILFANGSEIYLKDLYLYPSDPDFTALGSLEISDAFIDEAGEVSEKAAKMLSSRIRYRLDFMALPPKLLLTCNPTRNWIFGQFYKAAKEGSLPHYRQFVPALISDNKNPDFVALYQQQLARLDQVARERLLFGNWEFNSDALALFSFQRIEDMFQNNLVPTGTAYISADIARFGADCTVIGLWQGLRLVKCHLMQKAGTDETTAEIRKLASEYKVPNARIIIDADGIGGGVVDQLKGVKSFIAQSKPVLRKGRFENYANLKAQCYFLLAEMIERGEIFVAPTAANVVFSGQFLKERLSEELMVIKRVPETEGHLKINFKPEMKAHLGRSPDLADMLMMRMYFALTETAFHFA